MKLFPIVKKYLALAFLLGLTVGITIGVII